MLGIWPCPGGDELVLQFDKGRERRVLVLPALFGEANKLRHFTVEVMRHLDAAGVDSFLPDFNGCNESVIPLWSQTLAGWREQASAAAEHFSATHVLTIRGGALLDAGDLPGICYAPVEGASILKTLLRARVLADREAGVTSNRDDLLAAGKDAGLMLSGYHLGAEMIGELETAVPARSNATVIAQSTVGGAALWLRSEPSHDQAQAGKLAELALKAFG